MKKFLQKIYDIELKIREVLGIRFTYLLIVLSIIGCMDKLQTEDIIRFFNLQKEVV